MIWAVTSVLYIICTVMPQVPPINEDDPELYSEWTTPSTENYWWRFSQGAEFIGNLFAGRGEFPWLVDIRSVDLDSEFWSVGNLVTLSHVITTARALEFVIDHQKYQFWSENEGGIDEGLILNFEYTGIEINFCGNYLWEEYKFNTQLYRLQDQTDVKLFDHDVKDTGTRYASFIYRHPYWQTEAISWDIGVIKMNVPIRPLPPVVDYMPLWFDNLKGEVTDIDLSHMVEQRRVCYVASYGKNWINWIHHQATDYKLRYRVYYLDLKFCLDRMHLFRKATVRSGEPFIFDSRDLPNVNCFGTRAKVGAVCDHDRGAPLVCDGRVYGIVVRGANYTNCNNVLPLPFFVLKGTVLNNYYASLSSHLFLPRYTAKPAAASESRRVSACAIMLSFSLLMSLWYNVLSSHGFSTGRHRSC